jgi:Major intrinsic protein
MTKFRPLLAEFIGTFALIFVGIGAIKTAGHDVLAVALAHGLTIAAFVSATLHISGGQLNPAVTFGLLCGGHMKWPNALRYWIAQCLGGISAALICLGLFGRDVVITGTPQLAINLAPWQGILVEAILTFFLVFVVYGVAVDERGPRRNRRSRYRGDNHARHSVWRNAHRRGDESRVCARPSHCSKFLARPLCLLDRTVGGRDAGRCCLSALDRTTIRGASRMTQCLIFP